MPKKKSVSKANQVVLGLKDLEKIFFTKSDGKALCGALHKEIIGVRDDLRAEISGVRSKLNDKIISVRDELKTEIGGIRSDLRAEISRVSSDLHDLQENFTRVESKLDTFIEQVAHVSFKEHAPMLNEHEKRLDSHEDRLKKLETAPS